VVPETTRQGVQMPRPRVRLLGRCTIEIDGVPSQVEPLTAAVLIRLAIDLGTPVRVDEIYRDVWQQPAAPAKHGRGGVQQRVHALRRALDPENPNANSTVLLTVPGRPTGYKLMLERDQVDIFEFIDLVEAGRTAVAGEALARYAGAL